MLTAGLVLIAVAVLMSPTGCALASSGMAIAWSIVKHGRKEPGWRAIVVGGVVAIILVGIPIGLSANGSPGIPPLSGSNLFGAAGVGLAIWLLPMGILVAGAALMVEGFRAAAT
jgi:hypothetical protein